MLGLKAMVIVTALATTLGACGIGFTSIEAPVSGRVCDRVPQSVCASSLADAEQNAPPGAGGVVGIEVRCTVASCTDAAGDATIRVTYANGQTTSSGMGWAQAAPAPVGPPPAATPLPVEPVCRGVPQDWCRDMAASADATAGGPPIVSIVVTCTTVCTTSAGDGKTDVMYADGSKGGSSWNYNGEVAPASP